MSEFNFLDINFYKTIPIWIYLTSGFGTLFVLNVCAIGCYICKMNKRKAELVIQELQLHKKELEFDIKKNKKELEKDDVRISSPAKYSEFVKYV